MALSPDSSNKNSLQRKLQGSIGTPCGRNYSIPNTWGSERLLLGGAELQDPLLTSKLLLSHVHSLISMKSCLFSTMALPRLLPSSIILQHIREQSMQPWHYHCYQQHTNAPSFMNTDKHELIFTYRTLFILFLHLHWQIAPACSITDGGRSWRRL